MPRGYQPFFLFSVNHEWADSLKNVRDVIGCHFDVECFCRLEAENILRQRLPLSFL
jgi:hypothetical protein